MKACKCGNQCADNARSCPKCGYRFTHPLTKAIAGFFALIIILMIIGAAIGNNPSTTSTPSTPANSAQKEKDEANWRRAVLGAKTLESAMRNPDTFKLSQVLIMDNGSVCYQYRAQNGFGGMNIAHAVLTASGKFKNDNESGFRTLWNRECANKTGSEKTWEVNYAIGKESILGSK